MEIESFLPFVLAFMSLGSFELGSRVREHVHVLLPYKDPVTLMLFLIALSPVIASCLGHPFLDISNVWYLSFATAFLLCYSLAYLRGEFDMMYVNTHTIVSEKFPGGAQEVRPIVYYYGNDDGRLYCQEQSFKEILKTVIFGVRSPLDFPMNSIKRTRPVYVQKVLLPLISVDAVDVVSEQITVDTIVKWKVFKFKVKSFRYTPAPSCVDSTQSWLVSAYNQDNLTRELTRKEAQLLETKVSAQSQFYARSGDLLVELINDRTPGADVYDDVIDRLKPEPEVVINHESESQSEAPAAKKKSIFRKSPKDEEQTEENA